MLTQVQILRTAKPNQKNRYKKGTGIMRITKAMIYNKYGINYNSKSQKIDTPCGLSRELLRKGNKKIGKHVYQWSMTTETCACKCKDCYGVHAVHAVHLGVVVDLGQFPADFIAAGDHQCMVQHAGFRLGEGSIAGIHVVGDFFAKAYVDTWREIIKKFPNLIFWTYTKTKYANAFDDLPNANIVKSLVNGKLNFGKCEHVLALYDELTKAGKSVHICKCGVDENQHCEGCHKCSISEFVLFLEHSTAYKAEEDPLYKEFTDVVNNQ